MELELHPGYGEGDDLGVGEEQEELPAGPDDARVVEQVGPGRVEVRDDDDVPLPVLGRRPGPDDVLAPPAGQPRGDDR